MKFKMGDNGRLSTEFNHKPLLISTNGKEGFKPFQLLISSIVGCMGDELHKIFNEKKVKCSGLEIETNVERNIGKINSKVEDIQLHFLIQGDNMNEKVIENAIEMAKKN